MEENPLVEAVVAAQSAALAAFNPDDTVAPPRGGGTKICRVTAGDATAMELWDAHAAGDGCGTPFLWVRVRRTYPSDNFPSPTIDTTPCTLPHVAELEVGIGRCIHIPDPTTDWKEVAEDAANSIDDAWRLRKAACVFRGILDPERTTGVGPVNPIGPQGGIVGWVVTLYATI